jgi:hypothetical protein
MLEARRSCAVPPVSGAMGMSDAARCLDASRRPACLCTYAFGGAGHGLPARRRDGIAHRRSCRVAAQGAASEDRARQLETGARRTRLATPTIRRKATGFKAGRLLSIVFGALPASPTESDHLRLFSVGSGWIPDIGRRIRQRWLRARFGRSDGRQGSPKRSFVGAVANGGRRISAGLLGGAEALKAVAPALTAFASAVN